MNDNYIENETTDIVESLEPIEALQFAYKIINKINMGIIYEQATQQDKKDFNTLTTIELQLKEIIERNEVK